MSYVTNKFDDQVVKLLKSGGVGFMPSDTIYGLHALALNKESVEKIHQLKKRDSNKPLIVLISDLEMLDLLSIDKNKADVVKDYWPGPLSVVFSSAVIPSWLQLGTKSLAVRLPANTELRALVRETGPLVSTSANLQGDEPVASVDNARQLFGGKLDFFVDCGVISGVYSTLVKIEENKLKVLRPGAVKINEKEQL